MTDNENTFPDPRPPTEKDLEVYGESNIANMKNLMETKDGQNDSGEYDNIIPKTVRVLVDVNENFLFLGPVDEEDLEEMKKQVRNHYQNLYCTEKLETTGLSYPSYSIKKYQLLVTCDSRLCDIEIVKKLNEYADQLFDISNGMGTAIHEYAEKRDSIVKNHVGKYIIFFENGVSVIVVDKELTLESFRKYGAVSMKIGDEYPLGRVIY